MIEYSTIHDADIEALAAARSFEELSAAEQTAALNVLGSADSYARLRKTVLHTQHVMERQRRLMEPRADTHARLQAVMARRAARDTRTLGRRMNRILNYNLPVYQVAAALVLTIGAAFIFMQSGPPAGNVVYITAPDAETLAIDTTEIVRRVADSLREEFGRQIDMINRQLRDRGLLAPGDTLPHDTARAAAETAIASDSSTAIMHDEGLYPEDETDHPPFDAFKNTHRRSADEAAYKLLAGRRNCALRQRSLEYYLG